MHQKVSVQIYLTAIVADDNEHERSSFAKRLSFLQVDCITDFRDQRLGISVASEEQVRRSTEQSSTC